MRRAIALAADLRLTLLGMAALCVTAGVGAYRPEGVLPWIAAPVVLLTFNLLAAMAVDGRFRRRVPLLGFHLCLLAVVALGGAGELVRFTGSVELAQGQAFDPGLVRSEERGHWHPDRLDRVAFTQADIKVRYGPGLRRIGTESRVRLPQGNGRTVERTVGDEGPLLASGYRFYPTSNKGFAAYLSWTRPDGSRQRGTVHFPSFPLLAQAQENRWQLPGGEALILTLDPDVVVPESGSWILQGAGDAPTLYVYVDGRQETLRVGDRITVGGNVVRFDGVELWMGYWIYSEPTMAWLLAAAILGMIFIGWHVSGGLRRDDRLAAPRAHIGAVVR
ncbi:MAG: hypothetical protein Kow006_09720 [Gammaproteobacteria bacterium]